MGWASMMGTTYALLADCLPRERTGVYMGIFNLFIVVPMLLQTVTFSWIYTHLLGSHPENAIRLAGGQNAVVETFPQPYPALTREYILRLNPDVLLGGSFGKLDSTFFRNYPELRRIRAYQNRRVFAITGNLMERPGPRVVESVRELKRLIKN